MRRRLKVKLQMDLRWPTRVRPTVYKCDDAPEVVLAAFGSAITVGLHLGRTW